VEGTGAAEVTGLQSGLWGLCKRGVCLEVTKRGV
jgi:hypothetical protein